VARGKDQHDAYNSALQLLGKDLARRAKSRCELSGENGPLFPYDLYPDQKDPTLDQVLLVTRPMTLHLDGGPFNPEEVRFLEQCVWSPEPAVRLGAIRLLERIESGWAKEAIENASLMG